MWSAKPFYAFPIKVWLGKEIGAWEVSLPSQPMRVRTHSHWKVNNALRIAV